MWKALTICSLITIYLIILIVSAISLLYPNYSIKLLRKILLLCITDYPGILNLIS